MSKFFIKDENGNFVPRKTGLLHAEAEEGIEVEGGGSGEGDQAAAEAAAAQKAAEEAAAAKKAEEDAAAAKKAAEETEAARRAAEEGDIEAALKLAEDEKARLLKETMKRKDEIKAAQEAQEKTQQELEAIKSSLGGLDLAQISSLVEEQKEAERKALEAKGEYEQIVEQMKSQHTSALDSMKEELESANSKVAALSSQVEELTVGRAFSDSTFIREQSTLPPAIARQTFAQYFEANESGELVGYTAPKGDPNRAPLVDAEGRHKSFDDAIADLYTKHPDAKSLIKARQKAGAGSGTENVGNIKPDEAPKGNEPRGVNRILNALAADGK